MVGISSDARLSEKDRRRGQRGRIASHGARRRACFRTEQVAAQIVGFVHGTFRNRRRQRRGDGRRAVPTLNENNCLDPAVSALGKDHRRRVSRPRRVVLGSIFASVGDRRDRASHRPSIHRRRIRRGVGRGCHHPDCQFHLNPEARTQHLVFRWWQVKSEVGKYCYPIQAHPQTK